MKKTYTYTIRKRGINESINWYGYELIIYENWEEIQRNWAFGSISMAEVDWCHFIEELSLYKSTSVSITYQNEQDKNLLL
mgnify:CR=1 FL=1